MSDPTRSGGTAGPGIRVGTRETQLLEAFATLADTLVADYHLLDLLQTLVETCQSALDVDAAGLLLVDETGALDFAAATSEASSVVETIQVGAEQGPCIESFRTAAVVSVPDIEVGPEEWSEFRNSARESGFRSACAIPLRLRDATIGTLNLFRVDAGELNENDIRAAQALADVATIGILQERAIRERDEIRSQLQLALNSRVVIEQAKGVLAQTHGESMGEAFARLRSYARRNSRPLALVAQQLVERTIIF
jgi:GAF domain-containing protein